MGTGGTGGTGEWGPTGESDAREESDARRESVAQRESIARRESGTAGEPVASAASSRILLVGRDRLPVDLLRRRLEGEGGHRVEAVTGLSSALERLDRDPFGVVLLGPVPSDAPFEEALVALTEHVTSPAMVVAGGPDNTRVALWALQAGACAYLTEGELREGSRLLRTVTEVLCHRQRQSRIEEEATHLTRRLESIERLFEGVTEAGLSAEEQIGEILRLGCELFRLPIGIVSSIDGSRYRILYVQAPSELGLHAGQIFDLGLTYCSITLARNEPVMIEHTARSGWSSHPCYREQRLESYIGARIEVGGNQTGTLNFSSPDPRDRPFRNADRDLMVMMSTWTSTVLVRQRLDTALRESEELYRDLVENSSDLICTHDLEGEIRSANRILVETFGGGDPSRVVGHNLSEFLSPSVRHELPAYLDEIRRGDRSRGYMRVLDPHGSEHILEYHNSLRREGVEEPVVRAIARDVTELKRAEEELRHSEEMLRVFVKHTPAAVAMFDRQVRYLAVSDRWRVDYRLGGIELLGRSHYQVFPEHAEHWREIHERCLEGGVEQADEDPLPRSDGTLDWVRWEVRPWRTTEGEIGGLLMFTEVITDRKRVEEALRYLATHDHLTGLPNRTAFLERLERSLKRSRRTSQYGFAVFFLDLDDFKEVNDAYGHSAGDELLKQVGERLRRQLRPKDDVARFAGDEFVGLLEDTGRSEEARAAAERLLAALHVPFDLQGRTVEVGCSLGIALSQEVSVAEELLKRADRAMYVAKEAGKRGWHLDGAESRDPSRAAESGRMG